MTTVTPTITASTNATAHGRQSGESLISSDFDTWLNLLTAQLRNQDPFDPVDSTEYTAQLAQFSAVEQQVRTNELMTDLISLTSARDMAAMADWVGKDVRAAVSAAYQGASVTVFADSSPTAHSAQLVVRDQNGNETTRIAVPVGESVVEWSGIGASGTSVPWGFYRFEVESFGPDGARIATTDAQIYAKVVEVQRTGRDIALTLEGGESVATDSVSAVRNGDT